MKKTMTIAIFSVFSLLALQPASASVEYGDLIKGSSSTVYFVTSEHKRLAFMDERTFGTWYPDFSSVVTISDADLGNLAFGGTAPIRPGIQPIKGETDSRVYGIDRNGALRWLSTDAVASMIYGSDWSTKLVVVSDTDLAAYAHGSDVTGPNQYWWKAERDASPNLQEVNYRKMASMPIAAPVTLASSVTLAIAKPAPTRIIIIPTVINDNGGRAKEGDVDYLINDGLVMPQDGINVLPGAYTIYHGQLAGYTASAWSGDCTADGVVTVPANATRACFITFDDMPDGSNGSKSNRAPSLAIYAEVINRHGGTLSDSDFKLFIGSMQVTSGHPSTINAADYTLYGVAQPGYTASLWSGDCTQQGTVALHNGDEKTCYITFTD